MVHWRRLAILIFGMRAPVTAYRFMSGAGFFGFPITSDFRVFGTDAILGT